MRRLFIFVLLVNLGGLGPASLSASARLSSGLIECATQKVQFDCDEMNMAASSTRLTAAQDTSCCFVSSQPTRESQFIVSDPSFAAAPTATPLSVGDAPRVRIVPPDILVHDFSPPASQSRLCTFLI